jgi:hypothetical protein
MHTLGSVLMQLHWSSTGALARIPDTQGRIVSTGNLF